MKLPRKVAAALVGAALIGGEVGAAPVACRPATPSPCAADGSCHPGPLWGRYQTRWRRWPGDFDAGRPAEPTRAPGEDTLLGPVDVPKPDEEDAQAPPPIDESGAEEGEEGQDEGARDLNLPPLPAPQAPAFGAPAPAAPGGDAPPPLPFGAPGGFAPPPPAAGPGAQFTPPAGSLPRATVGSRPAEDTPPPMPLGFTRLAPKLDQRVQPALSTGAEGRVETTSYQGAIRSLPPVDELP